MDWFYPKPIRMLYRIRKSVNLNTLECKIILLQWTRIWHSKDNNKSTKYMYIKGFTSNS